jgi:hypothetical protein
MLAKEAKQYKTEQVTAMLAGVIEYVEDSVKRGEAAHVVEREIFNRVLEVGREALGLFFRLQGAGDVGETFAMPDGRVLKRLDLTPRPYQTVFGDFTLQRFVYGSRPKQKIEFVPLDQRLSLPESEFSYLLQEWDQLLGVEQAFGRVVDTMRTVLRLEQSVDSLERMNRKMSEAVGEFRAQLPAPDPDQEGEILVVTIDNKGVPMIRSGPALPAGARRKKGEKANKKQQAAIGCVYTVDPKIRTAEEVVAALFRERRDHAAQQDPEPKAQQKRIMSCLSHPLADGGEVRGQDEVFRWMAEEALRRYRPGQPVVFLSDGERRLETDRQKFLEEVFSELDAEIIDILDLLHVTPRLWEAAYLFYPEGSTQAAEFVRPRLTAILEGRIGRVIGGLRQMGTKHKLKGAKKKKLTTICSYLSKNAYRMRYDEYLASGLPIATGVIEGACRYVIKDRMERSGMRWTVAGAQAMLDLRTTRVNDQWVDYQEFRVQRESARLYPNRDALEQVEWPISA